MKMELNEAIKKLEDAGLIVEGNMSLKDKIANAKHFNVKNKLSNPTEEDLYGYRHFCSSFASLKELIVDDLKQYFDEETAEAILKSYGETIYSYVMNSELPSDELARQIVKELMDEFA